MLTFVVNTLLSERNLRDKLLLQVNCSTLFGKIPYFQPT